MIVTLFYERFEQHERAGATLLQEIPHEYNCLSSLAIPSGKNNGLGFALPLACILPRGIGSFQGAPIPSNEMYRLQVLRRLRVLDTVSADSINITVDGFTILFWT